PDNAALSLEIGLRAVEMTLARAPEHAAALCYKGMLRSAAGNLADADVTFRHAQTADPHLPPAYAFAGYNSALLGHPERTARAIDRAMQLDKTDRRVSIWSFFAGFSEMLLG